MAGSSAPAIRAGRAALRSGTKFDQTPQFDTPSPGVAVQFAEPGRFSRGFTDIPPEEQGMQTLPSQYGPDGNGVPSKRTLNLKPKLLS
jgi:hypothetical protein